jgi:hypothetical protein
MSDIPQKIIFDAGNNKLRDSSGNEITTNELFPNATQGQKFPINMQVTKNAAGEKYKDIEDGSTAEILVDDDYLNPSPIIDLPGDATEDFWKVSSGSEYYYSGTEIEAAPDKVYLNDILATEGTLGALNASEWVWDSGNSRLVVRLADSTDPDTKGDGWVGYKITVTYTPAFIEVDGATFNLANSWYDEGTQTFRNPVITDGEMSFEINAKTADYYNRLENKKWKTETTMQVQLLKPSTAEMYKMFEFQFVCKNRYLGTGYTVEISGANVYSKAESDARYWQKDLSVYTNKPTLSGSERFAIDDGGTPKQATALQLKDYFSSDTGAEVTLPDATETPIELGDAAVYRYFDLRFTIDDSISFDVYGYIIKHDGVTPVTIPFGKMVESITAVAISFDISGGKVRLKVNNTSGGALKLVWVNAARLIVST